MKVFAILLLFSACKFPALVADGHDGAPDDDGGVDAADSMPPDSDAPPDGPFVARTIQEVHDPSTPNGTLVQLTGVIVTAVDTYGPRTGDVWVQEPGGGPNSGIKVVGLESTVVSTLQFRDVVDISGVKDEYALSMDTTGRTAMEITPSPTVPLTLTKQGFNATVTLDFVDADAVAALPVAQRDQEYRKWDGAYIQLTNVKALTGLANVGQTGDKRFQLPAYYVITWQSDLSASITTGTCFAAVRGVVDYFFDYLVVPPQGGVLTTGGVCP